MAPQHLQPDMDGNMDFVVPDDQQFTWISVQGFAIQINAGLEGVIIDVFRDGDEMGPSFGGTWVAYSELETPPDDTADSEDIDSLESSTDDPDDESIC